MVMETERLLLREYTPEDFDTLYEILSDPETMRHYPAPFDAERTKRWIDWNLENYEKYGFGLWAVVLKETGEFIGDCGITIQNIDGEMLPEIGYHIHTMVRAAIVHNNNFITLFVKTLPENALQTRPDVFFYVIYWNDDA